MLRLEKHISYGSSEPFFYIYYGDIPLFYGFKEADARQRYDLIKSMGIDKYMQMTKPQIEVLAEEMSEEQRQDVDNLLGYLAGER